MRKMQTLNLLGALVVLATVDATIAIDTYPQTAQAQTQGMQRREDRRDTRQQSRDVKHQCNASGDKSRAGCRQEKRDVKQSGRQGETPSATPQTTANPPPH